ncbi:MAG: hypothetical protein HY657_04925 [Acidobacteria bacterium]|nr:hypothetical protein [Acidobacteriota bacterium]
MTRALTLTLLLSITVGAPAAAELRYTTHAEARRLDGVPADPLTGEFGAMLVNLIPSGETVTIVGVNGVRVEMRNGTGPVPPGSVMLLRGEAALILDPPSQTFWVLPTGAGTTLSSMNPQVSSARTGEFAAVAGLRAERVTYTVTLDLPLPAGAQLPAGFPRTFTLDGEMWVVDRFGSYAAALAAALPVTVPGLNVGAIGGLAPNGLIVRQITRSALFGYEIEFVVSDVTEEAVSPDLFQVPPGYREVPRPGQAVPR